ncbi:para-aminobenzoate synthase, (PABA) [Recurvomyces mirabilis]|uniref:aminodeoxychorismate synthase n=1 Tax=Recurvomyces mirabilis TaxID=574656 RepID=A0AAE0TS19_9PEZI|nr:para-aminobenzoate synthase, (PABA) [Recurvomyces mirabilis]KAK5155646.1 para-aminobenzoate synthase, (PABA) [Recurvomyces mirabilis]
MTIGRILYLDAFDSFSNNIISLLVNSLPVTVECIKINDARFVFNDDAFKNFLNKFDGVVAGAGPGHPENADDVGLIGKLWEHAVEIRLPVLGICLGFQSLMLHLGAAVERLEQPRHGLVRHLTHCGRDLFEGMDEIEATQYHSLHVKLSKGSVGEISQQLWQPSRSCKEVVPLAWDLSDASNGPVLMAARHCHLPFWGVQYHPESICSGGGPQLVQRWWNMAHGARQGLLPSTFMVPNHVLGLKAAGKSSRACGTVQWKAISLHEMVDIAIIVEAMREDQECEFILLESGSRDGRPINAETGRFSIIGLPTKSAKQLRWSARDSIFTVEADGTFLTTKRLDVREAFTELQDIVSQHKAEGGAADIPFWGGLVGYISYEAGLRTIDVHPAADSDAKPDMWFVMVERSIVVDHVSGAVHVQSLIEDDEVWLRGTEARLLALTGPSTGNCERVGEVEQSYVVSELVQNEYCRKVEVCQEQLRAGESYELCLTDQTLIANSTNPWTLYQHLRLDNPAPFGAYFHLGDSSSVYNLDIISSSPERFLSWSRQGRCQFRPIKGTVKKSNGTTRAKAEKLLSSEKERAENLMIVDLIRHDLNGVEGVRNVTVPKLMQVEEYSTVFQLVSVIEGDLNNSTPGISALVASLPPGSMTGAPKKRSCELLKSIEGVDKPRGLYSGVLGYLDVGGGGDFSVIIRTAFRWAEEGFWRVGAGGAVTALSEPLAEWEEMLAKRQSLLELLVG